MVVVLAAVVVVLAAVVVVLATVVVVLAAIVNSSCTRIQTMPFVVTSTLPEFLLYLFELFYMHSYVQL